MGRRPSLGKTCLSSVRGRIRYSSIADGDLALRSKKEHDLRALRPNGLEVEKKIAKLENKEQKIFQKMIEGVENNSVEIMNYLQTNKNNEGTEKSIDLLVIRTLQDVERIYKLRRFTDEEEVQALMFVHDIFSDAVSTKDLAGCKNDIERGVVYMREKIGGILKNGNGKAGSDQSIGQNNNKENNEKSEQEKQEKCVD